MRRDFVLSSDDTGYLDSLGLDWEAVRDPNQGNGIIVHKLSVPTGYNVGDVDVLLRLDTHYPDTHIDMVYFYPDLKRTDGKAIPNSDQPLDFNNIRWQRWSRHRTEQNPWRPGIDNIGTHMELVNFWLSKELKR